jgi:hypothetical protein
MAKNISCPIVTPEIETLATYFRDETPRSVANLVGVWQERNSSTETPNVYDLRKLKEILRREDINRVVSMIDVDKINQSEYRVSPLNEEYDPTTKNLRVGIIAQRFSDTVDILFNEHKRFLQKQVDSAENESERSLAKRNLDSITRQDIIKFSPQKIFDSVKQFFEAASDPENIVDWYDTQEKAEEAAFEFGKMVRLFDYFIPEVKQILAITENMLLRETSVSPFEVNLSDFNEDGSSTQEGASKADTREEEYKDHWMEQAKFINPATALSKEVRSLLRTIVEINKDGTDRVDDLGFPIYINPNMAHAVLIKELSNMTSVDEMIPMLEELSKKYAWVSSVIVELEKPENESLFSKFYVDFRKDFQEFRILTKENLPNDRHKFKLVSINKDEGVTETINEWQSALEGRNIFDDNAIYDNKGNISVAKANEALNVVKSLDEQLFNKTSQAQIELANNNEFFKNIVSVINRVGININPADIKEALLNYQETEGLEVDVPAKRILNILTVIYQGVIKKTPKLDTLISDYNTQYKGLANILRSNNENDIVSSVRENGNSYYSHTTPSYWGKMIKRLKGLRGEAAFQQYIQEEFGQYDWFKQDDQWMNTWIETLVNDPEARKKLDHHTILNANVTKGKREYVDWTPLDYQIVMLSEYFIDGKTPSSKNPYAYYYMPIMADSQSAEFIHFKRHTNQTGERDINGNYRSYKEQILDGMEKLVMQEYNRIVLVQKRDSAIVTDDIKGIKNFDIQRNADGTIKSIGGTEFKFLPRLNSIRDNYFFNNDRPFVEILNDLINTNNERLKPFIRASIENIVEAGFNEAVEYWDQIGLLNTNERNEFSYLDINGNRDNALGLLNEYYWNSQFATSQIIQLTTTDLAFYNGIDDFQKRFKQTEAKALKLNTNSTYGKKLERVLYLQDQDGFKSSVLDEITQVLDRRVQSGLLHSVERESIINKFKDINVADAQAYRSLFSYRSVMDMAGRWTPEQNTALENIRIGKWEYKDFNALFQPIKPFVFTQGKVRGGVFKRSDIKVPVQHKNAEYLLLAAHSLIAGNLGNSSKLVQLNKWMNDNNIDVVQFNSAVKVGEQGNVNINEVSDVYKYLDSVTKQNGVENPDVVHTINYEDYGIQVELPEHTIDTEILFGTQLRALIISDLPNVQFNIDGNNISKDNLIKLYNELIVSNVSYAREGVEKVFSNPRRLNQAAMDELSGNPRYPADLMNAIRLRPDGKPTLPYYTAINGNRIESLFSSMIKNPIIRQKIKGGSYVQVSGYGLLDELEIKFNEDGSVKYWEAYLPYWTKKRFKGVFQKGSHVLNIDEIPEELRKVIGYRIPTENKYSSLPIYVKGFLPSSSGDAIMLPADITKIVGSDFDVDKMYLMFPEFETNKKIPSKIKYDYTKSPSEQSVEARNNALIDIMWGILTNKDVAGLHLIPGNYDKQKHAAALVSLVQNLNESEIRKLLNINKDKNLLVSLRSMSVKKIEDAAKTVRYRLDPLSPETQLKLQQRNMIGAKMIGVIASNKKQHALMQHTSLEIKPDYSFVLNGKRYTLLNQVLTPNKREYISEPLSGFLAASVDNGKDPVLGFMNINGFTINSAMLLSRLGYSPIEITLLLSQPSIVKISEKYNNGDVGALEGYISKILPRSGFASKKEALEVMGTNNFSVEMLFKNIIEKTEDILPVLLFERIQKVADDLSRLTRIKVDNGDGGIGPNIANSMVNIKRIKDVMWDAANNKSFTLSGADYLSDRLKSSMDALIQYIQEFYSSGINNVEDLFKPYFFQYTQTGQRIVDRLSEVIASKELSPDVLNKAFNEWISFKATGYTFFGKDGDISIRNKRMDMIYNFPKYFSDVISKNPLIADLPFIKKLKIVYKEKNPFPTIEFINANKLLTSQKEQYQNDWASLIYNNNEEAQRLGIGLMLYASFKGGFAFGPSNFISLSPVAVQIATPQFVQLHEDLMNNDKDSVDNFIDQFVRNHLDDKKLVEYLVEKNIPNEMRIEFSEDDIRRNHPSLIKEIYEGEVVPKRYFAAPTQSGFNYYKLINPSGFPFIYEQIKPLGVKNVLLEYEYGKSADEIDSIVEKNNATLDSEGDLKNDENTDVEDITPETNQPYNVTEESSAYADDIEEFTLNSIFGTSNVPGEENVENKRKSFHEYDPIKNWTDKDGMEIC